ncbi:MAG: hydrolase [Hyphomicrobiaceae bacterium]
MTGRMRRTQSQLLVVDIQDRLLPTIDGHAQVVFAAERLIRYARRLDVPMTISEQYPRGLGPTSARLLEVAGNEAARLDKVEFSCLANPALAGHLDRIKAAGRSQIVVAGMEAHVCVLQTVLDLLTAGYEVFLVADGVGSRAALSRSLAIERMRAAGATIVDNEMVMFEWLERAGSPEFKELQKLLM